MDLQRARAVIAIMGAIVFLLVYNAAQQGERISDLEKQVHQIVRQLDGSVMEP
jgi:hypothetical protein